MVVTLDLSNESTYVLTGLFEVAQAAGLEVSVFIEHSAEPFVGFVYIIKTEYVVLLQKIPDPSDSSKLLNEFTAISYDKIEAIRWLEEPQTSLEKDENSHDNPN